MQKTLLAATAAFICAQLLHTSAYAADELPIVAKQLAGAPEEFASMAKPAAIDTAIYSKSALIPVDASNGVWSSSLPLDADQARVLLLDGGAAWDVSIGVGESALSARMLGNEQETALGMQGNTFAARLFELDALSAGEHQFNISASRGGKGFLLIEGDEDTQLVSYEKSRSRVRGGERISLVAHLAQANADSEAFEKNPARITQASLRVSGSFGEQTIEMYDDGQHDDGKGGDGLFGASFTAPSEGQYTAQVTAYGTNSSDEPLVRSAEHVVESVAASLSITGAASVVANKNTSGMLDIAVPVAASKAGHVRGYAEVWGRSAKGEEIAVAWVSGMVTPSNGAVTFGLDQRWIQRAGANAPYELRNVRFEDPDHFVTITQSAKLDVQGNPNLVASKRYTAVDEQMQFGPRPAAAKIAKGVGQRLILVHGYCSGAVWPASQFANASSFLDANQNRSHDQFARLIQSYGNTWNSFGIVAHSQGGAAGLHLYNYYWSGLDNATGSRLIQSVGTPYKGTNLAGVLAALGGIFGVGCGTNNDLTYSGASSWLAGIPNASRAKVNYYTTSFRSTNWWTNDYCNFASDLVLGDPEDGTTEQANGQLSGGVNRGHTTGQCHTAGMRDPAQYLDSSRNATMSANAAR